MSAVDVTKLKAFKTMPTVKSNDTAWINWMKALSLKYGEDGATTLFLKLWAKRGSASANTTTLRHELSSKYNIEIDESVFDEVEDAGAGIAREASKIFRAGKITLIVAGAVMVVALPMLLINMVKSPLPRVPYIPR